MNDKQVDDNDNNEWYSSLVEWIQKAGGHVHKSLILTNQDGMRGIACQCPIPKGELLIRLPPTLALSGDSSTLSDTYSVKDDNNIEQTRHASPWLKCLGALYRAYCQGNSFFQPYLKSLPSNYEHLLQWDADQVEEYLKGTTLGTIVQEEQSQRTLERRYKDSVRPYLTQQGALSSNSFAGDDDQEEMRQFRQCCMCISTRGFHLQNSGSDDTGDSKQQQEMYNGPFLLPFIDLLNHNPRRACTTLQRDETTGDFCMIAEYDIAKGQEILHSYGTNLTSAQVLQTFGFVPDEAIQRAMSSLSNTDTTNATINSSSMEAITPAMLSRNDIVEACTQMIKSRYPANIQTHVEHHRAMCEETWQLSLSVVNREIELEELSDNFTVEYSESPLSNPLVTLCTLLLVPNDTFAEFMADSPALLDTSVLQDYFLGKLVCKTLLIVIDNKLKTYGSSLDEIINKLRVLYDEKSSGRSVGDLRGMFGLTIRLEEMACLEKLSRQVSSLAKSLDDKDIDDGTDDDNDDGTEQNQNGKRKRDSNR